MTKTRPVQTVCFLAVGLSALPGLLPAVRADDAPAKDASAKDATAWKSSAFLGATLTRGNSETLMVNGNINTTKKWDKNEIGAGASVTYGEDHNNVTASAVSGFGQYNRLFTERLYGYARVDALHDDIAKVDYRVTLSPGAGYYVVKNDKFTLAGEAGPGYAFERLDGDERDYLTLRFGERFTWKINDRARLWQMVDFQPRAENWGDYVMNGEIGIETDITKQLKLRLSALDSYRSRPAPGRKENDLQLIAGLGYSF